MTNRENTICITGQHLETSFLPEHQRIAAHYGMLL